MSIYNRMGFKENSIENITHLSHLKRPDIQYLSHHGSDCSNASNITFDIFNTNFRDQLPSFKATSL